MNMQRGTQPRWSVTCVLFALSCFVPAAESSDNPNRTIKVPQKPVSQVNALVDADEPVEKQEVFGSVTLEQALQATPRDLASGYLVVFYNYRGARLARFGATLMTNLDGPIVEVNRENAEEAIRALKSRIQIYSKAIEQRGYRKVPQQFMAQADDGCKKFGISSGPILIQQNGFLLELSQNGMIHEGVIVENVIDFEHSNGPDVHLVGQIDDGQISLKTKVSGLTATMNPTACVLNLRPSTAVDHRYAEVYLGRGMAKYGAGKFADALKDVEESLTLNPDLGLAYTVRSQILASSPDPEVRDGEQAVQSATRACELVGWDQWQCLAPLAAAYAETGDFDSAINWASKAIEIPTDVQHENLEKELRLYKSRKPFRHNIPFHQEELE
jgi:tetratricopeptide (TPR) repeat protein